jgi:hypothetical protein
VASIRSTWPQVHRPLDRHAAHDAPLVAVIIDRFVLRREISQITTSPADQRQRMEFSSRVI